MSDYENRLGSGKTAHQSAMSDKEREKIKKEREEQERKRKKEDK